MKKLVLLFCVAMLLCGCAAPTFEIIQDDVDVPAAAVPATILLDLPEEAAAPVMKGSSGTLYFCDDYDVAVEILPSGNLSSTLQTLTGFGEKELDLLKTQRCGVPCYEGVWSAAGEAGDQVGCILVLDDGKFHYCVSVLAAADSASEHSLQWQSLLESVSLTEG